MAIWESVYNNIENAHIHLLVCSKQNRFGQSLLNLNPEDWEKGWSDLTKYDAVIRPIYNQKGAASYIATKNLPWGRSELIQPYNARILMKARIIH